MECYFLLVEPGLPENIGAAARAIKTMGFNKLRLVNPANHLADEARWLAHASTEILESAEVYDSFDAAVKDIDLTIATTAKRRSAKFDYYSSDELPGIIKGKKRSINSVGVVFGKEESGLDNEVVQRCDLASYIPMKSAYPSLNLAQAVMVFTYELSKLNLTEKKSMKEPVNEMLYPAFKEKLDSLLRDLRIDRNTNLYHRILERAAIMEDDDINLALSILNRIG